jgi:hypothetical protein
MTGWYKVLLVPLVAGATNHIVVVKKPVTL